MHGMIAVLGHIGVLAALLLQHGPHDPLDELWDPEFILLIVFLGGLISAVVWLGVRIFPKVRGDEHPEPPRDSAEEILRERFARGEITAEEYQRAIDILRGKNTREVPHDSQELG